MDRGAWQTMVHGVARVGHDVATKPPHQFYNEGNYPVYPFWIKSYVSW